MRVFELAKSLKLASGDVLRTAKALDIEASSTLAKLEDSDVSKIRSRLRAGAADGDATAEAERKARIQAKRAKAASQLSDGAEAEKAKLQAAIDFSKKLQAERDGAKSPASDETAGGQSKAQEKPAEAKPAEKPAELSAAEQAAMALAAELAAAVKSAPVSPAEPAVRIVTAEEEEERDDPNDRKVDFRNERDEDEELEEAYVGRGPRPNATMRQASKQTQRGGAAVGGARGGIQQQGGRMGGSQRPDQRGGRDAGRIGGRVDPRDQRNGRNGGRIDQRDARNGRNGGRPDPRDQRGQARGAAPAQRGGRGFGSVAPANQARPMPPPVPTTAPDHILTLRGLATVRELAELMGLRPNKLVADLMQWNVLASINQRVEMDMAERLADKYGYKIELERQRRSNERRPVLKSADADDDIPEDAPEQMKPRPPIITFLGHVDHGKTSLLDRIRKTSVAAGEAGGITQHIGAYTVELDGRKITFLDTPGHAAFSAMRARGANLTDIAVIVIAADDGIMPQTREAIRHARSANVQIMVAINKCDKPEAQPDRVRQQLQGEGLTPDTWGGDIVCVEVSAHTGKGLDHLLEMILLQADMLELAANPSRRADGYVIESQLELGRGPTASLLVMGGTLNVGDVVLCGEHFGRVRGLTDDRGRMVKSAGPGQAVRVMGLSGVPEPGSAFRVMLNLERARELAEQTTMERKERELAAPKIVSLDDMLKITATADKPELQVIVKADTQGSVEAIVDSLKEIRSEKVSLSVIHSAIGNVNNNDVQRATAGKAIVIGFQVGCESGVQAQARHDHVAIQTYRIIYDLLDNVKKEMLGLLPAEYKELIRGHADIRQVFGMSGKKGKVAGCQLTDGSLRTDSRVRVLRGGEKIFDGKILSLHHFQNEVSEVKDLQECGVRFEGFDAFAEGDTVECYFLQELERTL